MSRSLCIQGMGNLNCILESLPSIKMKFEKFQHEVVRVKSWFWMKLNYVKQFIFQGLERSEVQQWYKVVTQGQGHTRPRRVQVR